MKNLVLIFVFVTLTLVAKAQDSTIALSTFEKVATTPGNFYRIEENIVGNVRNELVTVIKIRDIICNVTVSVIRLSPEAGFDIADPIISNRNLYIEKGDIDKLIKNLEYYAKETKTTDGNQAGYYSFVTSTDVQFLCKKEEFLFTTTYLTVRKLYQYLRTPVLYSTTGFNKRELDRLIDLLKMAATQI